MIFINSPLSYGFINRGDKLQSMAGVCTTVN